MKCIPTKSLYHVVDGQMRYDPQHLARVVATTEDEEAFLNLGSNQPCISFAHRMRSGKQKLAAQLDARLVMQEIIVVTNKYYLLDNSNRDLINSWQLVIQGRRRCAGEAGRVRH